MRSQKDSFYLNHNKITVQPILDFKTESGNKPSLRINQFSKIFKNNFLHLMAWLKSTYQANPDHPAESDKVLKNAKCWIWSIFLLEVWSIQHYFKILGIKYNLRLIVLFVHSSTCLFLATSHCFELNLKVNFLLNKWKQITADYILLAMSENIWLRKNSSNSNNNYNNSNNNNIYNNNNTNKMLYHKASLIYSWW